MSQAHPTVLFRPQTPMPVPIKVQDASHPVKGDDAGDGDHDLPSQGRLPLDGSNDIIGDVLVDLVPQRSGVPEWRLPVAWSSGLRGVTDLRQVGDVGLYAHLLQGVVSPVVVVSGATSLALSLRSPK